MDQQQQSRWRRTIKQVLWTLGIVAVDYEDSRNSGRFYVGTGDVEEMFELTPTQYRAVRSQQDQTG